MQNPATVALFAFFCGTISINAFIALFKVAYPAIAWAQAINIVLSLIGITWYFVWFSQSLNLRDIGSELNKLPLDAIEKTTLLVRVLQDAADRRKSDDIQALLRELTKAVVQSNDQLSQAPGKRQAFREYTMAALDDAAKQAVRNRNDVFLRELIEEVFDLATKLAPKDPNWFTAFQDWFLGWYGEFLRDPANSPYSNEHFNKIYRYLWQLAYIRVTGRRSPA